MSPLVLVITGSRRWIYTSTKYTGRIYKVLDSWSEEHGQPMILIQGEEPKGTDTVAKNWAMKNGIPVAGFPAEWQFFRKSAGPIRNEWMLKFSMAIAYGMNTDIRGLAFPATNGSGTQDMMKRFKEKNIPFEVVCVENE